MRKFMNVAQSGYGSYAMEEDGTPVDETNPDAVAAADDAGVANLAEADELAVEVPEAIMECFRMEQISDSLEDLAVVADGIDEASPEEVALIRTVADMAVAGTDVESEEIIPETVVPLQIEVSGEAGNVVTESRYIGHRIATEGIRETARNIWEAIKKFLKDIWAKIEKFFYKIFGTIPMLRRKVEAIKKRADELQSDGKRPGKEKITISSSVGALSKNYQPVTTASALSAGIEEISTQAKWVYKTYATKLVKLGEDMAGAIADFEPSAPGPAVTKMTKVLEDAKLSDGGPSTSVDGRITGYTTKLGNDMLGSVVLEYRAKKNIEDTTTTVLASAGGIVHVGGVSTKANFEIRLTDVKTNPGTLKDSFEIKAFDASDIEDMCGKMLKLLDVLEEFKRSSNFNKITSTKEKLKKAADKAESAMNKIKDRSVDKDDHEGKAEQASVPAYRAMINTNTSFAKWASSPTMSFFKYAITEINAICMVSSKSLATYTKGDK